jgi:hypothetical protein
MAIFQLFFRRLNFGPSGVVDPNAIPLTIGARGPFRFTGCEHA